MDVDYTDASNYLRGMMTTENDFQLQVEQFMQRHRLTPSTFGVWAMDDSRFVFDLRNGRSCHDRTKKKVRKFMAKHEAKELARLLRILNPRYEDDPRAALDERTEKKCA